jgi:chromosome segregation ATPase
MPIPQLPEQIADLHDLPTLAATTALVLFQVGCWWWLTRQTSGPLEAQRHRIEAFRGQIDKRKYPEPGDTARLENPLARAWRAVFRPALGEESLDPHHAFEADRLLPREYDSRLDNAAPGFFTAVGIIGTFFGLLLAFWQIDPSQSESSIRPLIGGMRVAFINSLVGVGMSVWWTIRSRRLRHRLDAACGALADAVEDAARSLGRPTQGAMIERQLTAVKESVDLFAAAEEQRGTRFLTALTGIQASQRGSADTLRDELKELRSATYSSSRDLLEKLAPKLEESFKGLVDAPFERLTETVGAFQKTVADLTERHQYVLDGLDSAVAALGAAQTGLAASLATASECVQQFEGAAAGLSEQARATGEILDGTHDAARAIVEAGTTFAHIGERQGALASALEGAVVELRGTAGSLDGASTTLTSGAARLEEAVSKIQRISNDAAQDSVRAVRDELQGAIERMSGAMQAFGERSVRAYEESSGRVIGAVDGRMSDLTDRLSAELTTLAARLPEAVEEMTGAMKDAQRRMTHAVKTMDDAVRQLDAGTRKSLAAQLAEYDRALAQAVDHFSGTLSNWDGRVAELGAASREFKVALATAHAEREARSAVKLLPDAPPSAPPA